jgi:hypothetical protein
MRRGMGSNVGVRVLPKSRFTAGINPLGLGIMYSLEFAYKPVNNPTMHLVYGGITSQVNPEARIKEHKAGGMKAQKLIEKNGFSHQFTGGAKNEKKITYLALGAAFNDGLNEASFNSQVATIINAVSLFDLGALEAAYIDEYSLKQPNYDKINSVFDMFYGQSSVSLKQSSKGNYYGLNEAGGGEGALEKQPTQPDKLEWLYAAYYFIIEKDNFVKKSRKKAASEYYNEEDILSVKMKKLIKAKSGEQGNKLPYIEEKEITDFVKYFSIDEKTNNRISNNKEKPLLLGTNIFHDNNLLLTIEKKVQQKDFDDRTSRNFVTERIRNIVIDKNLKLEDKIKLVAAINLDKDNVPGMQTLTDKAINDAVKEVEDLGKDYMDKVKEQGFNMFLSLINDIFNKRFKQNYKPSSRIVDSLNSNIYKATAKARQLWLEGIVKTIVKNIRAGLVDKAGSILNTQLESNQDLINSILKELGLESTPQRKITITLQKRSDIVGEAAITDVKNRLEEPRGNKK